MRGFEGRQDALATREQRKRFRSLVISDADVRRAACRFEERVLGTNAGIVKPGRD